MLGQFQFLSLYFILDLILFKSVLFFYMFLNLFISIITWKYSFGVYIWYPNGLKFWGGSDFAVFADSFMIDCQLVYSVIGIGAHFGGCLSVGILCDLNRGCIPMGQFLIRLCLSLEKHYWSKTNFMLIPWPSLLSSLGCPCWSEAGTCLCSRREEKLDRVLWESQTKWEASRRQTLLWWRADTLTLPAGDAQQKRLP